MTDDLDELLRRSRPALAERSRNLTFALDDLVSAQPLTVKRRWRPMLAGSFIVFALAGGASIAAAMPGVLAWFGRYSRYEAARSDPDSPERKRTCASDSRIRPRCATWKGQLMNSETTTTTTTTSERDVQLRQLLVSAANAEAVTTPKRNRALAASVIAFAVAGAITGGPVSAAALSNDQAVNQKPTSISIEEMTQRIVRDDTQLFGTPFIIRSTGVTEIDLGQAPTGATSIALAFHCVSAGTFEYTLDGTPIGSYKCSDNDTRYSSGGGFIQPGEANEHALRISTGAQDSFVVWASWAAPAPKAAPSAVQQEAIADGVVTEAEYHAGFDRYAKCMSDAGHPVVFIDETGPIIEYSNPAEAVYSGHESRCYASEFERLDSTWQIQTREQTN